MKYLLLIVFLLPGCASFQQDFARQYQCRTTAGMEPDVGFYAFGLIGSAIVINAPDHQVWQHKVDDCVEALKEAGE